MKLKLDESGHVVLSDGKPVYIHDDGKEVPFDAAATVATITRLNGEAKTHREAKEAAETKLKAFDGIEDPAAAKTALATVANYDGKKMVEAGEVEKLKADVIKSVRAEYDPIVAERDALKGQLNEEIIGGSFARSKFAEDKVIVPRHMLQRTYGENFKVEDGKLVPYDANGNRITSRVRHGEIADFDEALELLIAADPYKDSILKGGIGAGGGAQNPGGGQGGPKTIGRAEFDKLAPADQMAKVTTGGFTVVD